MNMMTHAHRGLDLSDRIKPYIGFFQRVAENVAFGPRTPEGVHMVWQNSPGK